MLCGRSELLKEVLEVVVVGKSGEELDSLRVILESAKA
jgi:hypothetical protein